MRATSALASLAFVLPASAANILVLSSGDAVTDTAVINTLTARGHTCTLGPQHQLFNSGQSLTGFDTVYLQDNANWNYGGMPLAGQQAIVAWVMSGGRLVTSEWTTYYGSTGGLFGTLGSILPLSASVAYGGQSSTTYDMASPDPAIDAGLPATMTFALTGYSGTESYAPAKSSAATYFTSRGSAGAAGLVGWHQGSGSVFSFSTTCGPAQLADANFARLFSNVMTANAQPCYANCDGSTTAPALNVNDFACFLNKFASGDPYANCDESTTDPVLTVLDFTCFLNKFNTGCT